MLCMFGHEDTFEAVMCPEDDYVCWSLYKLDGNTWRPVVCGITIL